MPSRLTGAQSVLFFLSPYFYNVIYNCLAPKLWFFFPFSFKSHDASTKVQRERNPPPPHTLSFVCSRERNKVKVHLSVCLCCAYVVCLIKDRSRSMIALVESRRAKGFGTLGAREQVSPWTLA